MLLYFNNLGQLITAIPHGEPLRQLGELKLTVLFNQDYDLENTQMLVRYKTASSKTYDADVPMDKELNGYTFTQLTDGAGENIGSLHFDTTYQAYTVDLSDTYANQEAGNLKLVFTLNKTQTSNGQTTIVSSKKLDEISIYIADTLGLAPDSGLGMTLTEYNNLITYLTRLQNSSNLISSALSDIENIVNAAQNKIEVGTVNATNGNITNIVTDNLDADQITVVTLKSQLLELRDSLDNLIFDIKKSGDNVKIKGYLNSLLMSS